MNAAIQETAVTKLFTRVGTERTPNGLAGSKPVYRYVKSCYRCGGAGGAEKWRATGWTCFECGGSGKGGLAEERLYTAEQNAKLDAALAKRHAKAAEKRAAEAATIEAERAAVRGTFTAEHAAILAQLEELVADELATQRRRQAGNDWEGEPAPSFWVSVRDGIVGRVSISDKQVAMIQERHAEMLERRALQQRQLQAGQAGEIGKRVKTKLRVTFSKHIATISQFPRIDRYLVKLETEAGNQLVWWTSHGEEPHDDFVDGAFTVKEHDTYNGMPQTIVQRVKLA